MAELRSIDILQRRENLDRQNFRQRVAGLGQCKLRMGIGLDPEKLPAIVMYAHKRNIVCRATGPKC
ncbi:MAG TPA: hypothetical protein VF089_03525 [Candidatus Binatia bacterium]